MVIFCLQLQKGSENTKKTRRFSKEEIKKQLINSIVHNDITETEELNEKTDKREKPKDAAAVINNMKILSGPKRRTLYPFCIIKEKCSKDSRTRKSSSN